MCKSTEFLKVVSYKLTLTPSAQATGRLGALKSLGADYNEMIEQSGNRAQYSYSPNTISAVTSVKQINLRYLANLKDESGDAVYPDLEAKWNRLSESEKKKYE